MASGSFGGPPLASGAERRRDPADGKETTPLLNSNSSASKIARKSKTQVKNAVLRAGRNGIEFHAKSVASLVFIPWSVFGLVAASTALLLDRLAIVSYLVVLACLMISAIFIVVNFRNRQGPIYFYLGMLSLFAILCGSCAGKTVSDDFMAQYWSPSLRPPYVDVSPMSPAASVKDAGLLQFSEGTHVDTMRSIGVFDEDDGSTCCVAPVLSPEEPNQVEFWATGVDCCLHRGAFYCDDAQQVGAQSGVTVPVASSRRAKRQAAKLRQAAEQASVVYGLHMAQDPVFLHWVKVPAEFRQSELVKAVVMLLCQCAVYLAISFLLASWLHWSTAQARTSGSYFFTVPLVANGMFDSKGANVASQV